MIWRILLIIAGTTILAAAFVPPHHDLFCSPHGSIIQMLNCP